MIMTPRIRKFALTTHITASVGWLGAVAAFLALSIAGLTSQDARMVRAAYLSIDLVTWTVIVPLCFAALLTGLIQSLGTTWGLFRHYWVVAKLALTIVATIILLLHTQPIGAVAAVAAERLMTSADVRQLRVQLVADAGAALVALLVATMLSVYKPWGMTAYGRRAYGGGVQLESGATVSSGWAVLWLLGFIVVIALFAILHLTSGSLHQH